MRVRASDDHQQFPYFFVGTFIEAISLGDMVDGTRAFPYFFVGTFIEAGLCTLALPRGGRFPYFFVGTFIEAFSFIGFGVSIATISLLFRRDFH